MLPVWTSTKDVFDRDSEDAFLKEQAIFARLSESKLDSVPIAEFSLKKLFRASTEIVVPKSLLLKVIPEAIKICESGLDLELRHVLLEYTGKVLKIYAGSASRIIVFKEDLTNDEMTDVESASEGPPFKIALSVEHLRAVSDFITKVFGEGACVLGAKVSATGVPEALLLACYTAEGGRDDADVVNKIALFKLPREVGESPLPTIAPDDSVISNAPIKYTINIRPTIKWAFSNKRGYIEFVHTNGIMEVKFSQADGSSVKASLGAEIKTNAYLPPNDVALAALPDEAVYQLLKYAGTSPITMDIWFNERDGAADSDVVRFDCDKFTAYLAQSYKVGIAEATAYIAKIKNKVQIAESAEAATEASLRQNRLNKADRAAAMAAFKAEDSKDVLHEALVEIDVSAAMHVAEAAQSIPAPKVETKCESKEIETVPDDADVDLLAVLKSIDQRLKLIEGQIRTRSSPMKIRRAGIGTSESELLNYLKQCPGDQVTTKTIKQVCLGVASSTMHLTLHKFYAANVIVRLTRGRYYVPVDIESRVDNYLGDAPNTEILLPEELQNDRRNSQEGPDV